MLWAKEEELKKIENKLLETKKKSRIHDVLQKPKQVPHTCNYREIK